MSLIDCSSLLRTSARCLCFSLPILACFAKECCCLAAKPIRCRSLPSSTPSQARASCSGRRRAQLSSAKPLLSSASFLQTCYTATLLRSSPLLQLCQASHRQACSASPPCRLLNSAIFQSRRHAQPSTPSSYSAPPSSATFLLCHRSNPHLAALSPRSTIAQLPALLCFVTLLLLDSSCLVLLSSGLCSIALLSSCSTTLLPKFLP